MIIEYHRPALLEEALRLLERPEPLTLPLAGGTALNQPSPERFAVVDLQGLGLNTLHAKGNFLSLGATLTLQSLLESLDEAAARGPASLRQALSRCITLEATYNLRQAATVAGTLVAADGRSPFATALLALDATLSLQPGDESLCLGDLLPLRAERLRRRLITRVTLPLNARLAYEVIARTPADRPIVCAAAATWPSGRTRLALGGYGRAPLLALDGTEADGAEIAARSAYSHAEDAWASAEYRQEMAALLAKRCLQAIQEAQA
jgi:CO/xanthine dehydrogenase FAD-binding subunit